MVLDGTVRVSIAVGSPFFLSQILLGLIHLKDIQDGTLPKQDHYIHRIIELSPSGIEQHDGDDLNESGESLRIIVCMSPEGSHRLLRAHYVQSDIGFKRIIGFQEFELAAFDRDGNTSESQASVLYRLHFLIIFIGIIFCRVFVNRQSAIAHKLIFAEIEKLVEVDTGQRLRWRHLHATAIDEYVGILHWAADQHGGQAKGWAFPSVRFHLHWHAHSAFKVSVCICARSLKNYRPFNMIYMSLKGSYQVSLHMSIYTAFCGCVVYIHFETSENAL
jgi:hypothetical protein